MFDRMRAWMRGERKVKGKNLRGRVFEERPNWFSRLWTWIFGREGSGMPAKARPEGQISARVYRAATGEWEDLGVISRGHVKDGKIQREN